MSTEKLNETKVSTNNKLTDGKHACNLTIDWSGMSDREMQELAQRTIVIAWQQRLRNSDVAPPAELTIKARDFKLGVRKPSEVNPVTLIEKFTPEQLEHFMKLAAAKLGK